MPTLFVEADEPLLVFPSVEIAQRYLEASDVRNGVYSRAFGPSGEQFTVTAADDLVVIQSLHAPPDSSGLENLLRRGLAEVGELAPTSATLAELVAAAEVFWVERDPLGERFSKAIPRWGCFVVAVSLVALWAFL
ncbi:MAG: hypothetical protein PGN16_16255 [Sphingomonas phyllosphaerae]|uniref:hypothetical protein n=1 Tax=Sphingomonas phyllosphaerae TaxID=257003 RepID=UPI002FFA55A8